MKLVMVAADFQSVDSFHCDHLIVISDTIKSHYLIAVREKE